MFDLKRYINRYDNDDIQVEEVDDDYRRYLKYFVEFWSEEYWGLDGIEEVEDILYTIDDRFHKRYREYGVDSDYAYDRMDDIVDEVEYTRYFLI